MNVSRKLLRIWLTVSSFIGFVTGWVFLSHTVDTEDPIRVGNTVMEMPEIQPIPTLSAQSSGLTNGQTFLSTRIHLNNRSRLASEQVAPNEYV